MSSDDDVFPHDILRQTMHARLVIGGHVGERFKELDQGLFTPLAIGLSDQLSVYCDLMPSSRLVLGEVKVREGDLRSYLMIELRDGTGPLQLREATRRFDIEVKSDRESELVESVNGRRWRFIDENLPLMQRIFEKTAEMVDHYYAIRPYAQLKAGIVRFLEDSGKSYVCAEIDDRSAPSTQDPASRYKVN